MTKQCQRKIAENAVYVTGTGEIMYLTCTVTYVDNMCIFNV